MSLKCNRAQMAHYHTRLPLLTSDFHQGARSLTPAELLRVPSGDFKTTLGCGFLLKYKGLRKSGVNRQRPGGQVRKWSSNSQLPAQQPPSSVAPGRARPSDLMNTQNPRGSCDVAGVQSESPGTRLPALLWTTLPFSPLHRGPQEGQIRKGGRSCTWH